MKWASLDKIVKGVLLQKGYSMHYYMQCLVYARDCYRELTFDVLRSVNSVLLNTNDSAYATLPTDYVDWTKVGVRVGQLIKPLVYSESINRLPNYDDSGSIVPYNGLTDNNKTYYGYLDGLYWGVTSHFNSNGEFTGRFYGMGAGVQTDVFKIIPERCVIQLHETMANTTIVLEYISDGSCCSSATGVDPYAQACIDAYIKWQLKENRRDYSEGEKARAQNEYTRQRKILRARKNNMGVEEVKRLMQQAYHGGHK